MLSEIFFIDYGTSWSNQNYERLKVRYPFARKINKDSLENIFALTAKKSNTHQFWVIDGSIKIFAYFSLKYEVPQWDYKYIHTWKTCIDFKIRSEGIYLLTKDYNGSYKNFNKLFYLYVVRINHNKKISFDSCE